jgi:hypothetical protein
LGLGQTPENESESFFRWSGGLLLISLVVAMWIAGIYRERLRKIFESRAGKDDVRMTVSKFSR